MAIKNISRNRHSLKLQAKGAILPQQNEIKAGLEVKTHTMSLNGKENNKMKENKEISSGKQQARK